MKVNSIRLKLTLWYAVALALILVLFAIGTYLYVQDNLFNQIEIRLDAELKLMEQTLDKPLDEFKELELHGFLTLFKVEEDNWPTFISTGWEDADLDYANNNAPFSKRWIWQSTGGEYFHLKRVVLKHADKTYILTAAQNSEQIHQSLHRLLIAFLIAAPLGVCVGLLGGYLLAGRALAPIQELTARAQAIGAENLSDRLTVYNENDELGQLTGVLNAMFTRLEKSFEQLRRFTQDAAHELRTPLTVLRGVGEVGLQDQRDTQTYRDIIGSMLEEADRLTRLVDGLLTLARAESGRIALRRTMVNVNELCREVVECLRVLADDKQQFLLLYSSGENIIEMDCDTLRLALINLISNAIRFTSNHGEIIVRAISKENQTNIEVQDNGPGIAKEHHTRLFERFYRVDSSRSQESGGTGLGLAIALWAVEANQGTIELESSPGKGSVFRIILPK